MPCHLLSSNCRCVHAVSLQMCSRAHASIITWADLYTSACRVSAWALLHLMEAWTCKQLAGFARLTSARAVGRCQHIQHSSGRDCCELVDVASSIRKECSRRAAAVQGGIDRDFSQALSGIRWPLLLSLHSVHASDMHLAVQNPAQPAICSARNVSAEISGLGHLNRLILTNDACDSP